MKKLRFTLIVNRIVKNSQDFSQDCKTHFTADLQCFKEKAFKKSSKKNSNQMNGRIVNI